MTPRLNPSPFPLSRSSPQPKARFPWGLPRRSRSWLGLLCVASSIAAHGVLLALAMPGSSPEPPPAEAIADSSLPEDIAVTLLPKPDVDNPIAAVPATPAPVAAVPPLAPQAPAAPVAPVQPSPPPTVATPAPTPPAPEAAPESAAFTPPPAPSEPAAPSPYADFPHLEGAQATCPELNDCWRSPVSSSWRSAAGDLQARLESQGYTVSNITGEVVSIDSGVRVYAVSKPGEPNYYLNFVSVREGVLYTMTTEPMTSDQVIALQRS